MGEQKPVVIACAMEEEARPFLDALTPTVGQPSVIRDSGAPQPPAIIPVMPRDYRGPATFTSGTLFGHPTIVVTTGIGMTNAAVAATATLMQVEPLAYILAGTTGGLGRQVNVGHGIVAASTLYHDADASAFGYSPGQIPQMPALYKADPKLLGLLERVREKVDAPLHVGQVSASNSFVTAPQVPSVREAFPEVVAVDMETAAAAQVCYTFRVPWVSLRAVSDMCDPEAATTFDEGAPHAAEISFNMVKALINALDDEESQ